MFFLRSGVMPSLSATASALPRKAIGVLLQYPAPAEDAPAPAARTVLPGAKTPAVRKEKRGTKRRTTRSLSAVNAQRKFGFTTAPTDAGSVFEDESLDSIFIVTRHATHAGLVRRALETGTAVFVEKPLALTYEETDQIPEVAVGGSLLSCRPERVCG
jgi:hypothetical protein